MAIFTILIVTDVLCIFCLDNKHVRGAIKVSFSLITNSCNQP